MSMPRASSLSPCIPVLCAVLCLPGEMARVDPFLEPDGQNVTVVEGGTVVLGCAVHNMGAHKTQIIWRRGYEVLAAGPVVLSLDSRYSLGAGPGSSQLSIESARGEDGGEFVCQVQSAEGLREAKHRVTVQGEMSAQCSAISILVCSSSPDQPCACRGCAHCQAWPECEPEMQCHRGARA